MSHPSPYAPPAASRPAAATAPGATGAPPPSGGPVTGDGTTARSRAGRRWRAARWPLAVLAVLVVVVGLLAVSRPPTSSVALAPDNPGPAGAQAVARVLARQGVDVVPAATVADALGIAGPGDTLFVTTWDLLLDEQAAALVATGADLVLVAPTSTALDQATGGAVTLSSTWAADPQALLTARCDDPDAAAAGTLRGEGSLVVVPPAVGCFPDAEGSYAFARVQDGDRTVTVLSDGAPLRNDTVLDDGNGALALRTLGARERLVWLVADPFDVTGTGEQQDLSSEGVLPPWAGAVGLQLLLVVVVLGVWRARRLGALVPEDLPVVVRAAETTRGRGRLYRRGRSRGHAAAGLRAATADRLAARLGVPRSADAPTLVDAVVRAGGRPTADVADLLYGPPPADDAALLELARRLDTLESEVFRP